MSALWSRRHVASVKAVSSHRSPKLSLDVADIWLLNDRK